MAKEDFEWITSSIKSADYSADIAERRISVAKDLIGDSKEALLDHESTVKQDLKQARADLIAAQQAIETALEKFDSFSKQVSEGEPL